MKRMKLTIGVIIALALVFAVLLFNRQRMQAKSRPDETRFLPVTLVTAALQRLAETISLTGTISANSDVTVMSETQGRIMQVFAKVGDHVEAGAVLIQVDDELKKAAYSTAEANYEKTKKDLERFEAMYKDRSVSDGQLESARLAFKSAEAQYIVARRQYNDTKIKTPITGVVSSFPLEVGMMVQDKNPVANIVDISRLKVKLNVAEQDVFKLAVGDRVDISTEVYPGIIFPGTIATISAKADDGHTYPIEVSLANSAQHPLKAGMFARVDFRSVGARTALAIPREALVGSMKNAQVYVVDKGVARLRNIVVGAEVGSNLEVLSGLTEGEQVVSSGQNNLKDNVAVTVVK